MATLLEMKFIWKSMAVAVMEKKGDIRKELIATLLDLQWTSFQWGCSWGFHDDDVDDGCNGDDEDSDDDDDDDTGDDDDDFVNDDYLHLLHWHKATGQMWKQIILSNVRWILFWEDILQIRIHIKNTYGHMVSYDRKVMFCNNIC